MCAGPGLVARAAPKSTKIYWQIGLFKGNEFLPVVLLNQKPQTLVLVSPGGMGCRTRIIGTGE